MVSWINHYVYNHYHKEKPAYCSILFSPPFPITWIFGSIDNTKDNDLAQNIINNKMYHVRK